MTAWMGLKEFANKKYICHCGEIFIGGFSFIAHACIHHEEEYGFFKNILNQLGDFKEANDLRDIMNTNEDEDNATEMIKHDDLLPIEKGIEIAAFGYGLRIDYLGLLKNVKIVFGEMWPIFALPITLALLIHKLFDHSETK